MYLYSRIYIYIYIPTISRWPLTLPITESLNIYSRNQRYHLAVQPTCLGNSSPTQPWNRSSFQDYHYILSTIKVSVPISTRLPSKHPPTPYIRVAFFRNEYTTNTFLQKHSLFQLHNKRRHRPSSHTSFSFNNHSLIGMIVRYLCLFFLSHIWP